MNYCPDKQIKLNKQENGGKNNIKAYAQNHRRYYNGCPQA